MRPFVRLVCCASLLLPAFAPTAMAADCPVGDTAAFERMMERDIMGRQRTDEAQERAQQAALTATTDAMVAAGTLKDADVSALYIGMLEDEEFKAIERHKHETLLPRYLQSLTRITMKATDADCKAAAEAVATLDEIAADNARQYARMRTLLEARAATATDGAHSDH